MNAMGNDRIRVVNLIKSARVGYTKMLLGVEAYFIEHKSRNSLLFQPTDSAAEDFMKSHVEPTIRDVPVLLELAPWFGRKHRNNTLTLKRFSSGVGFWCLGGAAAKNYREKSVDVSCYDELSSFEPDVEKEGSPTLLGDKRIEGSVWPKSIRGSTPKAKGTCQIDKAANESAHFMRFHVPCPHCGEEQYLKFGDDSTAFGLKWEKGKPETVYYLCEHNGCVIRQSELEQKEGRWICDNTGMWTRDGLNFFGKDGDEIPPPRSISFHIWTAYSPFTTWVQIVYDWLDALKDPNGVKTFINTTLGETYEEAVAEKIGYEVLLEKVIRYGAVVPERVVYLTAGIDSQANRFEMYVWGWAPGEEAFLIDKKIIMGRPDHEETLARVDEAINKKYLHADGTEMSIARVCWDTGGIDAEIVYKRSKKHGIFRVLPIKGASIYGKPVINMPKSRNQRGVFLCEIGTDTAKEMIYARLKEPPTPPDSASPYTFRFPDNPEIFSEVEAKQLVAEELVEKVVNGKIKLQWDAKKRRNEALDCLVYAYAAYRVTTGSGKEGDPVRLVTTATTSETEYAFHELPLGDYTLTVRAINGFGQQGEPASVAFSIQAPEAPSTIEMTPGYFQITVTPYQAIYDASVQYEFWYSATQLATAADIQSKAQYLGTGSFWIKDNIRPGHDAWFYVRSVNRVGKSAFAEASGQCSDDAEGYLAFFDGKIQQTQLAKELLDKMDNTALKQDIADISKTVSETKNEIEQTVNKTLGDQSATISQIQKVQTDTDNNLNALYMLKVQKTKDGVPYVAGIGAGIEDVAGQTLSQILLAANRTAIIDPSDGNTVPMLVAQGGQIFLNEALVKYLIAPTITSGGNPPAFSLTPDGKLTAKNADISGTINANSGTFSNVHILGDCRVDAVLSANQIRGDIARIVACNRRSSVYIPAEEFDRTLAIPSVWVTASGFAGNTFHVNITVTVNVGGTVYTGAAYATNVKPGIFA
ncbi:terminase-like large protein [Salmonella enterica subsp. enterica serovar Miami str. 1923]|nr:terminase-like large protein [Salmonella enterica subsp. enterica serovar Miami str. 1923]